jgi:hypothetical protein
MPLSGRRGCTHTQKIGRRRSARPYRLARTRRTVWASYKVNHEWSCLTACCPNAKPGGRVPPILKLHIEPGTAQPNGLHQPEPRATPSGQYRPRTRPERANQFRRLLPPSQQPNGLRSATVAITAPSLSADDTKGPDRRDYENRWDHAAPTGSVSAQCSKMNAPADCGQTS